jgi:hypothetical protein
MATTYTESKSSLKTRRRRNSHPALFSASSIERQRDKLKKPDRMIPIADRRKKAKCRFKALCLRLANRRRFPASVRSCSHGICQYKSAFLGGVSRGIYVKRALLNFYVSGENAIIREENLIPLLRNTYQSCPNILPIGISARP